MSVAEYPEIGDEKVIEIDWYVALKVTDFR